MRAARKSGAAQQRSSSPWTHPRLRKLTSLPSDTSAPPALRGITCPGRCNRRRQKHFRVIVDGEVHPRLSAGISLIFTLRSSPRGTPVRLATPSRLRFEARGVSTLDGVLSMSSVAPGCGVVAITVTSYNRSDGLELAWGAGARTTTKAAPDNTNSRVSDRSCFRFGIGMACSSEN
jgi:hypothetical protein